MCGIAGVIHAPGLEPPDPEVAQRMVKALQHRGPDAQAVHFQDQVALGHARLSIIDLTGGHQPLFNEDRSISVICNGEIYNYQALRAELIERGHNFRTQSDCEVLVHLWEEEGKNCVQRLRGMFAFVIYDAGKQLLFGARDRFGQKPLYYYQHEQKFAFASEVKSLLQLPDVPRRLDAVALDQFLFYQFVPQPRTMFEDIHQLPPGHWFQWKQGELQLDRYWEPSFDPQEEANDQNQLDQLEQAVCDAVESHMVSDVPVGVFLSGGIDSSLMLAMASQFSREPLRTFSIGFPQSEADESRYARMAARRFDSEHEEFAFQPSHIEHCLETIAKIFCQPLADSAVMPLLFLSEQASKSIKVVLTGDGGDELFAGYRKYKRAAAMPGNSMWWARMAPKVFNTERLAACAPDPWGVRRMTARVGMAVAPVQRSSYYRRYWEGWDRHQLYTPDMSAMLNGKFTAADAAEQSQIGHLAPLNAMLRLDQASYLSSDLLLKTDQATMAYGIEARAPLLDHLLADFAGRLPIRLKVTAKQTKVALRKLAEKWLPSELSKRPKKGFSFPIADWFRGPLRAWVRHTLLHTSTTSPAYFRPETISQVLDEHTLGRRDHSGRIYTLLTFELWHRNFGG